MFCRREEKEITKEEAGEQLSRGLTLLKHTTDPRKLFPDIYTPKLEKQLLGVRERRILEFCDRPRFKEERGLTFSRMLFGSKPRCRRCGGKMSNRKHSRKSYALWKCTSRNCRACFSVVSGSMLALYQEPFKALNDYMLIALRRESEGRISYKGCLLGTDANVRIKQSLDATGISGKEIQSCPLPQFDQALYRFTHKLLSTPKPKTALSLKKKREYENAKKDGFLEKRKETRKKNAQAKMAEQGV